MVYFCFSVEYNLLDLRISIRVNPQHMRQSSFNQYRAKMAGVQDGLASRHHGLLFPLLSFFTFFFFLMRGGMAWEVGRRLNRDGTYVYLWLINVVVWQTPTIL